MYRILAMICFSLLATSNSAQNAKSPLQQVIQSMELFQQGLEAKNPELILHAAQIRKQASLTEQKPHNVALDYDILSWRDMLYEAEKYARNRPHLAGAIQALIDEKSRGVRDGALYSRSQIVPMSKKSHATLTFEGGIFAQAYVEAQNGADIALYIYDSEGKTVCEQDPTGPIAECNWMPAHEGIFEIVIENQSQIVAHYALITN